MSEKDMAAELARLRDYLVDLEGGVISDRDSPRARPTHSEREIARIRSRIAELEADLGI
jgi:hypothetical protein